MNWRARITGWEPPAGFVVEQVRRPERPVLPEISSKGSTAAWPMLLCP